MPVSELIALNGESVSHFSTSALLAGVLRLLLQVERLVAVDG